MSKKKLMVLLCLTLLFSFTPDRVKSTGKIVVLVTGLKSNTGKVMLAVFTNADDFPTKFENAYRKVVGTILNNSSTVVMENVPYGTYGIVIFHDENNNDKLDTNFIGIPKEGMGASRDAKGSMGPPKYEDAKFVVSTPLTNLKIQTSYF